MTSRANDVQDLLSDASVRSRRSRWIAVVAAAALVMVPPPPPPPAAAVASPVDAYLADWQEANGIPGVAVAIIDGAEVSTRLVGHDGNGDPVAATTPFLVGSAAKTFTSTLLLQLVDDGRLSLDDEARDHLPWLDHAVTIRQLLTHTAGYSAADGLAVSERYRADTTVIEAAEELDRTGGVSGTFEYSSANYLVLGAVIEQASGVSFAEELRTRIAAPMGMTGTGVDGRTAAPPPGHRLWWGRPRTYAPDPEPSGGPYGYVVTTLEDLVTYARALLTGALLSDELRSAAWTTQVETGDDVGRGLGWRVDTGDGELRVHHSGATPGYFAHLMLMPEDDRAVVVLANSYSETRAPSLAAAAADLDRLTRGGQAEPRPPASTPMALPWVALAPAILALLTLVGVALRRPRVRWVGVASLVVSGLATGVLALVPGLLGMTWHTLLAWAPDIAVGLIAGITGWSSVAVSMVCLLLLRARRARSASATGPL